MENPEEVLQALDEFQKMRPTEIPRELEDYLCWVAKTGDPVYQWSLIKALFRDKLARVMTDFYESCPSFELTPCPNVEHFNYDTMKINLLERLESFANAPFTVQRICELLTTPRKEYNRVDKFMRAIEKNILVVSTKEPGQTTRRSENGDGMVNGSIEEDPSITQPPPETEMDSWVKDCTTNAQSLEPVTNLPAMPLKIPSQIEDNPKTEETSSNSEFVTTIVIELPDANINEDTTSQPSLDLEDNDNVKTTFQSNDFTPSSDKESTFEREEDRSKESNVQKEEAVEEDNKIEEKPPTPPTLEKEEEEEKEEKKDDDEIDKNLATEDTVEESSLDEPTNEENINPTIDPEPRTKDDTVDDECSNSIRIEETIKDNPPPSPDKIIETVESNLERTENLNPLCKVEVDVPSIDENSDTKVDCESMEVDGDESVSNSDHERQNDEPMDQGYIIFNKENDGV